MLQTLPLMQTNLRCIASDSLTVPALMQTGLALQLEGSGMPARADLGEASQEVN